MNAKTSKSIWASFTLIAFSLIAATVLCSCSSDAGTSDESAESSDNTAIRVASLKGPTSIGLASMMQQEQSSGDSAYDFQMYASAEEVVPLLASGDVDIALIPANLAATLYGSTDGSIKAIDVNTLGVLYAITADDSLKSIDDATFADLKGRKIYMTGKGTVPDYTVQSLLDASGLTTKDVTIEFLSEPSAVVEMVTKENKAVGIVPQPFVTAALAKNDSLASIIDLTKQWDELAAKDAESAADASQQGDSAIKGKLVTGVTVARSAFIEQHPDLVWQFLDMHIASVKVAQDDPSSIAQTVVDLGIVGDVALAEKAIPQCNIVCLTSNDMKDSLSGYLSTLYELAPDAVGGKLPDDDFYLIG